MEQHERAFSLARFIPLLRERIYVLNPFTRTYLVSWLTVLDSVPELELVSFLPEFLDGLLKFLGDPTVDIRTATQNLLEDFLREVREVAEVGRIGRRESMQDERPGSLIEMERGSSESGAEQDEAEEEEEMENDLEGSGEWIAGQGVEIDHAAIIEILLEHSSFPGEAFHPARDMLTVSFTRRGDPVNVSALACRVPPLRPADNGPLCRPSHPRHPLLPRPPRRFDPHRRERDKLQSVQGHSRAADAFVELPARLAPDADH